MSIPDLPTLPEISSQTRGGMKYHILGPGRIWLHSMTACKMAHRLLEHLPEKKG